MPKVTKVTAKKTPPRKVAVTKKTAPRPMMPPMPPAAAMPPMAPPMAPQLPQRMPPKPKR